MAFGSGSSLASDCWTRRGGFPSPLQACNEGRAKRLHQASSSKAHYSLGVDLREANQPVAPPFFLSYSGSGEVIQRLARSQSTPMRSKVARTVSALTCSSIIPVLEAHFGGQSER